MDVDRFREDAVAELERRPVDIEGARRSVDVRARRQRRRISAGVGAVVVLAVAVAAGLVITNGSDEPSSLDVVSGGEDQPSPSTAPAPSELFFLVPDPVPTGMELLDVSEPGQVQMTGSEGARTTQRWVRFGDDGHPEGLLDVQVAEGTLEGLSGEPLVLQSLPANFDAIAGVITLQFAPGRVVTVTSLDLTRDELGAVATSWTGGTGTGFVIEPPEGFQLVATLEGERSTGPDVRSAYYGDGHERGFVIVVDEPVNDDVGAEFAFPESRAVTVRGQFGVLSPRGFGVLGAAFRPVSGYLAQPDQVLRWHERGSSVSLLGVGLTGDEMLALAEGLVIAPLPGGDEGDPGDVASDATTTTSAEATPTTGSSTPDADPYCDAVQLLRFSDDAVDPDGHPGVDALPLFEQVRAAAPDDALASLDVVVEWLRTGAARPVSDAVLDAELEMTQHWAGSCSG